MVTWNSIISFWKALKTQTPLPSWWGLGNELRHTFPVLHVVFRVQDNVGKSVWQMEVTQLALFGVSIGVALLWHGGRALLAVEVWPLFFASMPGEFKQFPSVFWHLVGHQCWYSESGDRTVALHVCEFWFTPPRFQLLSLHRNLEQLPFWCQLTSSPCNTGH